MGVLEDATRVAEQKAVTRHYCRWLLNVKGKRKGRWCWQRGTFRKSQCTPCLLAFLVGGLYSNPKPRKGG